MSVLYFKFLGPRNNPRNFFNTRYKDFDETLYIDQNLFECLNIVFVSTEGDRYKEAV